MPFVGSTEFIREGDGAPLLVMAISLPFVAVKNNDSTVAMDVRCTEFVRLEAAYVQALLGPVSVPPPVAMTQTEPFRMTPGLCPKCSSPLRLRKGTGPDSPWHTVCEQCNYTGKVTVEDPD